MALRRDGRRTGGGCCSPFLSPPPSSLQGSGDRDRAALEKEGGWRRLKFNGRQPVSERRRSGGSEAVAGDLRSGCDEGGCGALSVYPLPRGESNTKVPKFDGNNTSCRSDTGRWLGGPWEDTSGDHCITQMLWSWGKSQIPTKGQEGGGKLDGRTATNIPKIPSPASNHRKNWIFMDHQKKEPPNSTVPKFAEPTPAVALTRAVLAHAGGGGGGTTACDLHPRSAVDSGWTGWPLRWPGRRGGGNGG